MAEKRVVIAAGTTLHDENQSCCDRDSSEREEVIRVLTNCATWQRSCGDGQAAALNRGGRWCSDGEMVPGARRGDWSRGGCSGEWGCSRGRGGDGVRSFSKGKEARWLHSVGGGQHSEERSGGQGGRRRQWLASVGRRRPKEIRPVSRMCSWAKLQLDRRKNMAESMRCARKIGE
jgi:hypothetical protein